MGVPDTFKAAVVPEPGAQHVVQDRSLPPLEAGEVAIKVTATAINPVDWKIRDYKVFIKDYRSYHSSFFSFNRFPPLMFWNVPQRITLGSAAGD